MNMCHLHGLDLFFGMGRIRINAEQKRKQGIQKFLNIVCRHGGEKPFQAARDSLQRVCIGLFEVRQIFQTAVDLHIVNVHGHQFEHTSPFFQRTGQFVCKFLRRQLSILPGNPVQILRPCLVFPPEQGQEDLLLAVIIVVNGGAGKRGFLPDIPDGDISKALGLVEGSAGVDDLFFSGVGQFFGAFGHKAASFLQGTAFYARLSFKISTISS